MAAQEGKHVLKRLVVILMLFHQMLGMEKDLKEQLDKLTKENEEQKLQLNALAHERDALKKRKHHHTLTKIKNLFGYSGLIRMSPMLGSVLIHRAIGCIKSAHSSKTGINWPYYSVIGISALLSTLLMRRVMGFVLKEQHNISASAGIFLTTTFLSGAGIHYSYQKWCNNK